MTKTLEFLFVIFLSLFTFFLGVKYSDDAKRHASWIFEGDINAVELPDLADTQNPEKSIYNQDLIEKINEELPEDISPMIEENFPENSSESLSEENLPDNSNQDL